MGIYIYNISFYVLTGTKECDCGPGEKIGRERTIRIGQVGLCTAVQWERCTELGERTCACPCEECGYDPNDETCSGVLGMCDYHPRGRASRESWRGTSQYHFATALCKSQGEMGMTNKIPEPICSEYVFVPR
jgi:hypothetical protein